MSVCEQITQHKKLVLFIDDSNESFKQVSQCLLDDYEVQIIEGLPQALSRLGSCVRLPNIIISNLSSDSTTQAAPFSALQEWALNNDVPILFLNNEGDKAKETHFLSNDIYDFIEYPINSAELKIRVRNHLKRHHETRAAENASFVDAVTGLGNFRKLNELVYRNWHECLLRNKKLGLIVIDIDDFKVLNQSHGMNYGDLVLQMVADELSSFANQENDALCVIKGNQFALLKPECSSKELEAIADMVTECVKGLQVKLFAGDSDIYLSVSAGGYAMYPEKNISHKALLEEADLSLFSAKNEGGNCAHMRTKQASANVFNLGFGEAQVTSFVP